MNPEKRGRTKQVPKCGCQILAQLYIYRLIYIYIYIHSIYIRIYGLVNMELGHGSGVERPPVRRKGLSGWRVPSALAGAFGASRNISEQEFVFCSVFSVRDTSTQQGYHYTHEAASHKEPHERHPHERIMGSMKIL